MKRVLGTGALFVAILIAAFPEVATEAAKGALSLSARVIVPSLFPFFVCANLLVGNGTENAMWRKLEWLSRPLFGISGEGFSAVLLGFISGYPGGAAVVSKLYRGGRISKNEAERLLPFTNNAGPLFILGVLGTAVYKSRRIGYILWASVVLSSLLTGVFMRFFEKDEEKRPRESIADASQNAVRDAVETVLTLCGFIVFFSVLVAFLEKAGILSLLKGALMGLGMGEKTAALLCRSFWDVSLLAEGGGASLPAVAAILAFGGVSVLFQTASIVGEGGLSLKKYGIGKAFSAGFAALFCRLLLAAFPAAQSTYIPFDTYLQEGYGGYLLASLLLSFTFYGCLWALGKFCK